jgi:hypothetical protein
MAQVACFCGCCFSFGGAVGTCPKCGEVASLRGGAGPEISVRDWPEQPLLAADEVSRSQPRRRAWPELAETVPGLAFDVVARGR